MENYEFNEDASGEGGRRYKKDTTKRTLGTSIFNGAYLADRIAKLFTSDDITEEGVRTAQSYALYVKKGRIGLNFDSMEERDETMNANLPELIKQSYRILHDPRDNGNKMEFAAGVQKIGAINNRYTVYKNPYMLENIILMGFRGAQFLETGAVFAPYIHVNYDSACI